MGRGASKAIGNVWYEARIDAAKWNDRLASREGAAEALSMSVDAVTDAELGLSKVMPVDKAVLMADVYNKPSLLNYYCLHECPIGRTHPISDEVPSLENVTVALIKSLNHSKVADLLEKLVDIAEDGEITSDEEDDIRAVMRALDRISLNASKLRNVIGGSRGREG